jgi:hypothetical protein
MSGLHSVASIPMSGANDSAFSVDIQPGAASPKAWRIIDIMEMAALMHARQAVMEVFGVID